MSEDACSSVPRDVRVPKSITLRLPDVDIEIPATFDLADVPDDWLPIAHATIQQRHVVVVSQGVWDVVNGRQPTTAPPTAAPVSLSPGVRTMLIMWSVALVLAGIYEIVSRLHHTP